MNNKKRTIIALLITILILGGIYLLKLETKTTSDSQQYQTAFDEKNATYTINGKKVTLVNGVSEEEMPDSASKIITRYFGNEIKHDLNDDGLEDVVFLLTQETGGSGVFFYVVAALQKNIAMKNGDKNMKYFGSEAFLLGDRIAPQTTKIDEGKTSRETNRQNVIVVNYAVRAPNEPFTTSPSIGKSVWIKLDPVSMQFGEVAQNFEGENR